MLDRIREIVNKATRTFGTYSGLHTDGSPLHLDPIDWWATIYGGLTQRGMMALDGLVGLLIIRRAMGEESIPSMTDDEHLIYTDIIAGARTEAAEAEPGRFDVVRTALIAVRLARRLGDARIMELGYEETASLRAPFSFSATDADGNALTTIRGTHDELGMGYKADDFDLSVAMGSQANLDQLEFHDGKLLVGVTLSRIVVDFHFMTWPIERTDSGSDHDDSNSPLADVTNTLQTVGELAGEIGHALALTNEGTGTLTIENPVLTIELRVVAPSVNDGSDDDQPPAIRLSGAYDSARSSMTAWLDLVGFNLPMNTVAALATRIGDQFEKRLGDSVAESVENILKSLELPGAWPDGWHVEDGPPAAPASDVFPDLTFVQNAARFVGRLAPPEVIRGLIPVGTLDASRAAFSGTAVSRAYLAEWFRTRSHRGRSATPLTLDVRDLEQTLGVHVPRGGANRVPGSLEPLPGPTIIVINGRTVHVQSTLGPLRFMEILPTFQAERGLDVALPEGESPRCRNRANRLLRDRGSCETHSQGSRHVAPPGYASGG